MGKDHPHGDDRVISYVWKQPIMNFIQSDSIGKMVLNCHFLISKYERSVKRVALGVETGSNQPPSTENLIQIATP